MEIRKDSWMWRCVELGLGALLVCALPLGSRLQAQDPGVEPPPAKEVEGSDPVQEDAPVAPLKISAAGRAALKVAAGMAAKAKGTKGAQRTGILEGALGQYQQVLAEFAGEPATAAQAHYKSAELLRRMGRLADAVGHYSKSAELHPGRFAARGHYGVGQMQRRLKDYAKAIVAYSAAAKAEQGTNRWADAMVWVGRCHAAAGDQEKAVVSLRSALEAANKPQHVILTADWLAKALVRAGDLGGAGQAIATAEKAVADASGSPTEMARLQKRLEGMKSRRALQRARDRQSDAAGDAQEVEAQRGTGAVEPPR